MKAVRRPALDARHRVAERAPDGARARRHGQVRAAASAPRRGARRPRARHGRWLPCPATSWIRLRSKAVPARDVLLTRRSAKSRVGVVVGVAPRAGTFFFCLANLFFNQVQDGEQLMFDMRRYCVLDGTILVGETVPFGSALAALFRGGVFAAAAAALFDVWVRQNRIRILRGKVR